MAALFACGDQRLKNPTPILSGPCGWKMRGLGGPWGCWQDTAALLGSAGVRLWPHPEHCSDLAQFGRSEARGVFPSVLLNKNQQFWLRCLAWGKGHNTAGAPEVFGVELSLGETGWKNLRAHPADPQYPNHFFFLLLPSTARAWLSSAFNARHCAGCCVHAQHGPGAPSPLPNPCRTGKSPRRA